MRFMEDEERPPPYLGDYPHGAYWSAVAPEDAPDDVREDYSVERPGLRIMWDEQAGPLWDETGLLPDEPEWLQRALGLSDSLVPDLLAWMSDMTTLHHGPPVEDGRERVQKLDARGRALAERVQAEVGADYSVRYDA
jgi:hypothetical protein